MIEAAKPIKDEDLFETTNDSFTTSVQHQMQTSEGRKALSQHFCPLGQEYIGDFLSDGKNKIIDTVYGVRLDKDVIMMLGSKKFDVDSSDHIIIDGVRYGTLVFMSLSSKKLSIMTCIRKTINENTKAYYWLQIRIDAITPSIVSLRSNRGYIYNYTVIKGRIDDWERIIARYDINAIDYIHGMIPMS